MKRIIVAVLALSLVVPVFATETWSQSRFGYTSIAVCSTGTESAPSSASAGMGLAGLKGFTVHIETAGAMTAGGKLLAYLYNPTSGNWNPAPDLDLTVAAVASQGFSGFAIVGATGRIAYVPSGVGVASTIYIVGSP